MKIITNTKRNGELCYVQVKDILFLARITKNNKVMQQYVNFINNGVCDNDFVRITQPLYIDAFKKCDYIVDFTLYSNVSITYVSRLMATTNFFVSSDLEKDCIQHKTDDLRDIISFKKGDLEYKIPLISNGKYEYENEDGTLLFDSTIIDGCFAITSLDGNNVDDNEYYDFYLKCIDKIYNEIYVGIPVEERKFEKFVMGNTLVIRVHNNMNIKKEKKVFKIFSKIKKGNV